jgi:hypothetical protein
MHRPACSACSVADLRTTDSARAIRRADSALMPFDSARPSGSGFASPLPVAVARAGG